MDFKLLQKNWNLFGQRDPMWSILTVPGKERNRWDVEEFYETGRADVAGVLEQIGHLGRPIGRERALDFGCGVGRLTFALSPHFGRVDGVDIAESMIELAREQIERGSNCVFHVNTQADLSLFETDSFDLILTLIVLQHMEPQYSHRYLAEFLRVLKPGGMLVFQLPDCLKASMAVVEAPPPPLTPYRRFRRMFRFLRRFKPFQTHQATTQPLAGDPKEPVMEMYGTPKPDVLRVIAANGGRAVDIREDDAAGPKWLSWRYFVTKE